MIPIFGAIDEYPIDAPAFDNPGLIASIITWLLVGVGILAVVIIIYSAFLMVTAAGEPEKFKTGRQALTAGVIGLFIALMAGVVVQIIIGALSS